MRVHGRLLMVAVVVALLATACDWSAFRYGPGHTGFNPSESAVGTANVGSLVEKWTATTGDDVASSPAVVNGVAYVGSWDGKLYAFDATGSSGCSGTPKTCAPLWTATTGGKIESSPAVVNGIVYVGSYDNNLYAYDAAGVTNCGGTPKACAPMWTYPTGGDVASSPTVVNGVVYVGSFDNKLYAFDAAGVTGCSGTITICAPLWTGATGGAVYSSPAVEDGVVYVGSLDQKLYAFGASGMTSSCTGSPKTCIPLWTAWTRRPVESSPAVFKGVVYLGSGDGFLYAFDAAGVTGCMFSPRVCDPLWTAKPGKSLLSSPAVANGVLYIGSSATGLEDDPYGKLSAYDAAASAGCSGTPKFCEPLWTATAGAFVPVLSSPAVANGVVYIGSYDFKLYGFDAAGVTGCSGTPKRCTPLWKVGTGGKVYSSPTVANGMIYVGSDDNKLYAFGL